MATGRIALFGAVVAASTVVSAAAGAAELVGHRAVYRITLAGAATGSGIVGAEGAMLYRFADGCDGWTAENRTFLRLHYEEEKDSDSSWSMVTWEAKDGRSYRFRVHHSRDGETVEQLNGSAALGAKDASGAATFSKPENERIELPAGTLFPTRHLVASIAAAREGANRFARVVFDGSTRDNPYEVSALITKLPPEERKAVKAASGLAAQPMWRMRLAFFPYYGKGPLPEFEIDIRYREDGIADRLRQEFTEFSLELTLSDIEILPKPEC